MPMYHSRHFNIVECDRKIFLLCIKDGSVDYAISDSSIEEASFLRLFDYDSSIMKIQIEKFRMEKAITSSYRIYNS